MVYPMVLLLPLQTSKLHPLLCIPIPIHTRLPRFKTQPRRTHFPISSIPQNPYQATSQNRRDPQKQRQRQQQPPRTLYPGGYKRAEIKVPSFVLQLEPNDVLADGDGTLELIDKAVSKWVRIVVLNGAEASGGKLYEAACKLKSLVRDRAYLLVSERVDIAAAANASGVVLSDQGLPAIVARNTMMDSKSDSVFLPLVARNVQTLDAALNASNSEGADFLIYSIGEENQVDVVPNSVFRNVKIPIFAMFTSGGEDLLLKEASVLLKSGASGLVSTLKGFEMFSDDALSELFDNVYTPNLRTQDELDNLNNLEFLDVDNNVREGRAVAGFIKLEDREKQFIDREKSILLEAIKVIQRAAPLVIF